MENQQCPHCHKFFKGFHGLRIHIRRQGACNGMQHSSIVLGSASNVPVTQLIPRHSRNTEEHSIYPADDSIVAIPADNNSSGGNYEDLEDLEYQRLLRQSLSLGHGTPRNLQSSEQAEEEEVEYYNENLEIAYALLACRGDQGLSISDTNRLLAVFSDTRFSISRLKIRCFDDLEKFCIKLQKSLYGDTVSFQI